MPMNTAPYLPITSVDTKRGPSPSIWGEYQNALGQLEQVNEFQGSTHFYDDFIEGCFAAAGNNGEKTLGKWNAFIGNSASILLGNGADTTNLPLEGGILGITAGSNNNLSVTLAANPSTFRFITPATGFPLMNKIYFETSIAVSSVASGAFDLFVGLMDNGDGGTRITSAADLVFSAANTIKTASGNGGCLGFWKRATTNPSDVCIVHNVNNGTAQVLGASGNIQKLSANYAGGTMAALTTTNGTATTIGSASGACFLKLGFIFDPTAQNTPMPVTTALTGQTAGAVTKPLVRFYVNGKLLPIFYDATIVQAAGPTFATSFLCPVIGFRTGGSGAGVAYVDFLRCGQLPIA